MWRIIFLTFFLPSLVFGQFKNIVLDDGANSFPPSEPTVAINPKNPDNIVVSAILDKIYVTKDGGETWTKSQLSSTYGVWGGTIVLSSKKGDFHYLHLSDPSGKNWLSEEVLDRIVVHRSKNEGESWKEMGYLGHNPPKDQDKEWATIDRKGDLYVTWTQFDKFGSDKPEHKSNILFSSSSNGRKWSDPIQLNQVSGGCIDDNMTAGGAVPAVTGNGNIFVTWAYDDQLFLDRSYDKGKTWLHNDIVVMQQKGGWRLEIPGLQQYNSIPVLIADRSDTRLNGMIYLSWADQRKGKDNTDIWFISSPNGGDSWSSRVKVNDDDSVSHQFMNWMTQDPKTGFIYIVFYDRRNYTDKQTDVYLAYSKDGGKSFKNVKISEKPFIPDENHFIGDYIHIDAYDGTIVPVWTRMYDGETKVMTAIIKQEDLDGMQEHP